MVLKGLSSMATRRLLADVTEPGAIEDLPAVSFRSAGGVEVARRLRGGELVDLVILSAGAIASLVDDGLLLRSTVQPLFESEMVVACRDDRSARSCDISSESALRATLEGIPRIGYSTGPSGDALLQLFEKWGTSDEMADRLVLARPGFPVARLLTDSAADIGFQQRSELSDVPGVAILGPMPAGAEVRTVFTGAVLASSDAPERASGALHVLASEATEVLIVHHGFRVAF